MAEDNRIFTGNDPDSREWELKHRIAAAEAAGDTKTAESLRAELDQRPTAKPTERSADKKG